MKRIKKHPNIQKALNKKISINSLIIIITILLAIILGTTLGINARSNTVVRNEQPNIYPKVTVGPGDPYPYPLRQLRPSTQVTHTTDLKPSEETTVPNRRDPNPKQYTVPLEIQPVDTTRSNNYYLGFTAPEGRENYGLQGFFAGNDVKPNLVAWWNNHSQFVNLEMPISPLNVNEFNHLTYNSNGIFLDTYVSNSISVRNVGVNEDKNEIMNLFFIYNLQLRINNYDISISAPGEYLQLLEAPSITEFNNPLDLLTEINYNIDNNGAPDGFLISNQQSEFPQNINVVF